MEHVTEANTLSIRRYDVIVNGHGIRRTVTFARERLFLVKITSRELAP